MLMVILLGCFCRRFWEINVAHAIVVGFLCLDFRFCISTESKIGSICMARYAVHLLGHEWYGHFVRGLFLVDLVLDCVEAARSLGSVVRETRTEESFASRLTAAWPGWRGLTPRRQCFLLLGERAAGFLLQHPCGE